MRDLIDRRRYGVRAVCGTDAVDLIGNQRGAAVRHTGGFGRLGGVVPVQSIVAVTPEESTRGPVLEQVIAGP